MTRSLEVLLDRLQLRWGLQSIALFSPKNGREAPGLALDMGRKAAATSVALNQNP